ncbi:SGNH/GDSL hydrolase family protein [Gordonia shandongensis]|uniref:SGNH/GDSL hydrolase family protein n=1 Tax=Gordonia shandongensis TaxID=376351 RepID=UPI0003FC8E7C|nr:SGNH/GDSL hydrolase family protein [Gordonia shandongensis]
MIRRSRSLTRVLVAGAAALTAVTLSPAAVSDAAPRGTIVVLGDSFSANSPDLSGCSRGATSWPKQLAARTGSRLVDESCSGAGLAGNRFTIADEAQQARAHGGFTAKTSAVLMQFGLNGYWGRREVGIRYLNDCLLHGCGSRSATLAAITPAQFVKYVKPYVDYTRYYAPKARIAVVGYPELLAPGALDGCINVAGAPVARPGSSGLVALMNRIQHAQKEGARQLGIDFIDAQRVTRGRGLCGRAPLVNGVLNPAADLFGIPMHPSVAGDRLMASTIARSLRL